MRKTEKDASRYNIRKKGGKWEVEVPTTKIKSRGGGSCIK
jgi:hypothetical protein